MVEGLFYILVVLGTGFEKGYADLVGKLFSLIIRYFSAWHIRLIPYQDLDNIICCMHFDLFDPVFDLLKRLSIINGICHDYSHSPTIVCLSNCFESLLSCCIPYLQSYFLAIDIDSFDFEVDTLIDFSSIPIVVR